MSVVWISEDKVVPKKSDLFPSAWKIIIRSYILAIIRSQNRSRLYALKKT